MSNEKVPVYTDNGEVYAYSADSEPTDVLGTVIEAFSNNTEVPKNGDTLQVTLDKFYTFDRAFPTEVRVVPLTGFSLKTGKITSKDTILSAFEKTQQQFDSIPAQFTQAQVRSTPLSGVVFTNAAAIVAADTLLVAIGKLQAQITAQATTIANQATTIANQATTISGHTATIATLTTRLEALEGAADAG